MTNYLEETKKEEIERGSKETLKYGFNFNRNVKKKMRMFEGLSKKDVSGLIRDFSTSNPDVRINKIFFINILRDPRLVRACFFCQVSV